MYNYDIAGKGLGYFHEVEPDSCFSLEIHLRQMMPRTLGYSIGQLELVEKLPKMPFFHGLVALALLTIGKVARILILLHLHLIKILSREGP